MPCCHATVLDRDSLGLQELQEVLLDVASISFSFQSTNVRIHIRRSHLYPFRCPPKFCTSNHLVLGNQASPYSNMDIWVIWDIEWSVKHSPLAWKLLEHIRELSQEKQLQTQEIQLEIREKEWNIMKISDIETLNRNLKKNLADFWFRQIFSTDFSISGRVSAQKFKVSVRLEPSEVPPAIPRTWEMGYQWDMLEYIGIILGMGI